MPQFEAQACAMARAGAGVAITTRRFARCERGNLGTIFALSLIPMTLFVGAAVDIGRWLHARSETLSAMDAAVLAGARTLQVNPGDSSSAIQVAQAYYTANTKGRLELLNETVSFAPVENNTAFRATVNARISTPFLALADIKSLPILKADEYSQAVLSAGGKSETSIEIAMMLDVTGSMRGQKFSDMKAAATDLVTIVMADTSSGKTIKMGIVPFAEGVRLPSSANKAARGTPGDVTISKKTYKPTDCVAERTGTNKYTDVAPGTNNYVLTIYSDCELSANDEVLPLTSNKSTLTNKISKLEIAGSTAGQIGTAWAWYLLSPNWSALWPSSAAQAYNSGKLQKIAVLMTDGEYNTQYDSKGFESNSGANGDSTTQARAVCAAMKKAGITVYTVGFDLGGSPSAITTLSGCATDTGKFYNTTTGDQLKQAFRDIALQINQLYLTH